MSFSRMLTMLESNEIVLEFEHSKLHPFNILV